MEVCPLVQIFVAPHFAQPNSIEFEPALRWRHLQRSLAHTKRLQREAHAADLAEVMRAYQKVGQHSKACKWTPPAALYVVSLSFALHLLLPRPVNFSRRCSMCIAWGMICHGCTRMLGSTIYGPDLAATDARSLLARVQEAARQDKSFSTVANRGGVRGRKNIVPGNPRKPRHHCEVSVECWVLCRR